MAKKYITRYFEVVQYVHVTLNILSTTVYMYFLWAKINMASYGHTMFSLKLLILMVIRQCIMDQLVVGGRWSWQCCSPRHNFIGSIPNNINMPLLWAIINKAFTLLNSGLIRKHSVQFLGSCILSSISLSINGINV